MNVTPATAEGYLRQRRPLLGLAILGMTPSAALPMTVEQNGGMLRRQPRLNNGPDLEPPPRHDKAPILFDHIYNPRGTLEWNDFL